MSRHDVLNLCIITTLFSLCCFSACRRPPSRPVSKVILITLDTLRADHVGAYGAEAISTPNMDFYADNGIVFENAYSPIPITAPAHASLFYSLPPHSLPLYNNGQIFHPDKKLVSLAEIFQEKGYATAAFVSLGVLQAKFNLHSGFDVYSDAPHPQRWYLTAAEVNVRALAWLQENMHKEFFLWLHYSDPHDPYAPPSLAPDLHIFLNGRRHKEICVQRREELLLNFPLHNGENRILFQVKNPFPVPRNEYRVSLNDFEIDVPQGAIWKLQQGDMLDRDGKKILAFRETAEILVSSTRNGAQAVIKATGNLNLFPSEQTEGYRKEVEYLDDQLGELTRVLKSGGILDETAVILAGDHGEGLGEYPSGLGEAYYGHIHYLQQVFVKIPMIIYAPSLLPGRERRGEPVSLMDIAPTLLALQGWTSPSFYSGRNLLTEEELVQPPLFCETYTPEAALDRFSFLSPPWHLIFTPGKRAFELYDLSNDPQEKRNVYAAHSQDRHIQSLAREIVTRTREILSARTEVKLDKASEEMLRALGYIK